MALITSISDKIINSIFSYVKSRYVPLINKTNIGTGIDEITLDESSGVLVYSAQVTPLGRDFFLFSTSIKENSIINWSVSYSPEESERVTQCAYNVYSGQCIFTLGLINGLISKEGDIYINFRVE